MTMMMSIAQANKIFLDAVSVADKIGIDIEVVNFSKEYKEKVFSEFINEIKSGRTPNPDILCNSEIKFNAFLNHAISMGPTRLRLVITHK
jgi:tRNA-uridine 2-sulfurtransferase